MHCHMQHLIPIEFYFTWTILDELNVFFQVQINTQTILALTRIFMFYAKHFLLSATFSHFGVCCRCVCTREVISLFHVRFALLKLFSFVDSTFRHTKCNLHTPNWTTWQTHTQDQNEKAEQKKWREEHSCQQCTWNGWRSVYTSGCCARISPDKFGILMFHASFFFEFFISFRLPCDCCTYVFVFVFVWCVHFKGTATAADGGDVAVTVTVATVYILLFSTI